MPLVSPFTRPLEEPIVATAGVELVHVPPAGAEVSVVVPEGHIERVPEMAEIGFTETKTVRRQPVGNVYDTKAGPPAVPTPLTTPVSEPTETTVTALELHVPPGVVLERVVDEFAQNVVVPVIAGGNGFTVTTSDTEHPATV